MLPPLQAEPCRVAVVNQSINDFWKLLAQSKLLSVPVIKKLAAEFAKLEHASPPTSKTVAQWLLTRRIITKQQALVLLSGRPGPFDRAETVDAGKDVVKAKESVPKKGNEGQATAKEAKIQADRPPSKADEIMLRRKVAKKRNVLIAVAATTAAILIGVGGAGVWWMIQSGSKNIATASKSGGSIETRDAEGNAESPVGVATSDVTTTAAKSTAAATGGLVQQLVPDDGKMLWASPTAGPPVTFRCVPPEGQLFLILRPAEMLATEEGRRVFAALGPGMDTMRRAWEAAIGFKLEDIAQLHITLHNNDAKFPRASFVVKTAQPFSNDDLLARWGDPAETKEKDATYYAGPTWAYFLPTSSEDERTFAMGEARDIKDVAAVGGAPPAVFREIERLRRVTDSQRHFTLLFYPQFLFNDDGEPLFAGERAKILQPLAWLLGEHVQAAMISAHFGDNFYVEARLRGSLDKEPHALAQELQTRLNQIPRSMEDYFVSLDPPPYWKKLAIRYPFMVRELHSQLRIGVENDVATINTVLPGAAAHNLVLGGELVLSTSPGAAPSVAATSSASGPKTLAEALQIKTSFSFDQQSLEFAMRDLAEDVKANLRGAPLEFSIKILGDDLKLDGITRNQSIRDFKQEDQTVADILTALVRKANPVTTVKDPSEKDQKLVWAIGPDPDNPSKKAVLITTRTAAMAKKYEMGAAFVGK